MDFKLDNQSLSDMADTIQRHSGKAIEYGEMIGGQADSAAYWRSVKLWSERLAKQAQIRAEEMEKA